MISKDKFHLNCPLPYSLLYAGVHSNLKAGHVDLIRVLPEDEQAAWALFLDRSDQRYSFTDCTSFVLMRRLGISGAVALDEDFRIEGFETAP